MPDARVNQLRPANCTLPLEGTGGGRAVRASAAVEHSTLEVQTEQRPLAVAARPGSAAAKPLSYFDKLIINTTSRTAGQLAAGGEFTASGSGLNALLGLACSLCTFHRVATPWIIPNLGHFPHLSLVTHVCCSAA